MAAELVYESTEHLAVPEKCYVGVDVGSSSVRAALVTETGKILAVAVSTIHTWNPEPGFYEQSGENIWQACCYCIKAVAKKVSAEWIRGIGFDATCSLVAVGKGGKPVSVSYSGIDEHNVIMWMDHRATKEAALINETKHPVLKYVGGTISVEMETPKMLWLKNNLREDCWNQVAYFFDLPDYLTWKATGCDTRSLCSTTCKWTFEASSTKREWNESFFDAVGLEDLKENNWKKIGMQVQDPGMPVGNGLNAVAADIMELPSGIAVGTSLIDAHAGGLGLLSCQPLHGVQPKLTEKLAIIAGTSSCHMAISEKPTFVPGVWGPYYGAMVKDFWLNEGGQSACGLAFEKLIENHDIFNDLRKKIGIKSRVSEANSSMKTSLWFHISDILKRALGEMSVKQGLPDICYLTKDFHVWPDFHGNRSPVANPDLRGMISGMKFIESYDEMAIYYLALIQSLVYGTRHIVETMEEAGHNFSTILICGGLRKNSLYIQETADITGLPVILPYESESVLIGSAMMGAIASGDFASWEEAFKKMGGTGEVVRPRPDVKEYHDRKYRVFKSMLDDQRKYKKIMAGVNYSRCVACNK